MKKFITSLLALVLIISSCSCDNGNKGDTVTGTSGTDTNVSATNANVQTNAESSLQNIDTNAPINEIKLSSPEGYINTEYKNAIKKFQSITLDNEGNVYGITDKSNIKKYSPSGKPMAEIEDSGSINNIYYSNGYIYGYDAALNSIIKFSISDGKKETIYSNFKAAEIKNLVVIDNIMYILLVPYCENTNNGSPCDVHDHSFDYDSVGYVNFNEVLYSLDLKTAVLTDLKVANPIAIYASADDNLYIYKWHELKYALQKLDNGSPATVKDFENGKYVFSFVYENEKFIYNSDDSVIHNLNLKDNDDFIEERSILVQGNGDMRFWNGNVVYIGVDYTHYDDTATTQKITLNSFYMDKKETVQNLNEVSVYGFQRTLSDSAIKELTGKKLRYLADVSNLSSDEIKTRIMSKDDSIDLFIVNLNTVNTTNMLSKNIYEPLNGSAVINDYINSCFDYVKDAATMENGDIFGIPVTSSIYATWYNPAYFEQFGIAPDDLTSIDGFLKAIEKLDLTRDKLGVYVPSAPFCREFENQYDLFYNDFPNGTFDYNTEPFKYIYEHLWSGWQRYSGTNDSMPHVQNPYAQFEKVDINDTVRPSDKLDKTILKVDAISSHLDGAPKPLEGWRVLPLPRLSEKVDKNITYANFVLINPYSKNKESAMKVLECIAGNIKKTTANYPFLQKDIAAYEGIYDTTLPAFKDIFSIYENSIISVSYYPNSLETQIDDYQSGKLTLEEAIAEKQRTVEMALFE